MTQRRNSNIGSMTLGDLVVRDSSMNRDDFYKVIKTDSTKLIASNFFGTKSEKPKRNFRHEAEMLIIDHFNGFENNFGFKKPIGGRTI